MPSKHVRLSSSFIGMGAVLLSLIGNGKTVSSLWAAARQQENIRTFERFTLTLDMLHALGMVEFGRDGLLSGTKR